MASNLDVHADSVPCKKLCVEITLKSTPLHDAVRNGNATAVEELLKTGADINTQSEGYTPLHVAVIEGKLDCFHVLLDHGADVNITDYCERIPLHYAAERGDLLMLKRLLTFEFTINEQDEIEQTPLHIAIEHQNLECAEQILNAGVDVDLQDSSGSTLLIFAIKNNCGIIVEKLVSLNANVNLQEYDSREAALHFAVDKGDLNCVELLLKAGADIDLTDVLGCNPLHDAAGKGKRLIWKKLLSRKPETIVDKPKLFRLFEIVLPEIRSDYFDDLLQVGADIHVKDDETNRNLLHVAANFESELPLKKLLKFNLDIDVQDNEGSTPLLVACQELRLNNVLLLLDAGASWDIPNNYKKTALYPLLMEVFGCKDAEIPLLKMILERINDGLPIDHANGQTAAHFVLDVITLSHVDFNLELLQLVLFTQKVLDVSDSKGRSVLYYITHHLKYFGMYAMPLLHTCIERGVHLDHQDCMKIKRFPALRDRLLQDVQFCIQSIANQFNNQTLVKLYEHFDGSWVFPIESLRITPMKGPWRILEQDVRSGIKRMGYCDIPYLITTSLSKLCIESLHRKFSKCTISSDLQT